MKSVDLSEKASCEDIDLEITDADRRKHGEQIGLDTLVVHAANDEYYLLRSC